MGGKASSILVLGAMIVVTSTACGRIIHVDNSSPADFDNIQAAIDDANDGDEILIHDGVYCGDGNRDISFKGKVIMVRSLSGPGACIIDCGGCEDDPHRGFFFVSAEGTGSILEGVSVINGCTPDNGAGILCRGTSPRIVNCVISNNRLMSPEEDPVGDGAGICCSSGSPEILDCTISFNDASGGPDRGGGIACLSSNALISRCVIKGNTADGRGGGIYCNNSSPMIVNSLIVANKAGLAAEYGGGVSVKGGNPALVNCTIVGNSAGRGGGIDLISATAAITNCIVWGNSPTAIEHTDTANAVVAFCDIQGGWPGDGNIDFDPLFTGPNDYHIAFGSACIDSGTADSSLGVPLIDLDGLARPADGDMDEIAVVDMGVYELHHTAGEPALGVMPRSIRFERPVNGPNPKSRVLHVWNAGQGTLHWAIETDCQWLAVSPASGESSGEMDEVELAADGSGLDADQYICLLTVSGDFGVITRVIEVTFRVGPVLQVPKDYPTIQAAVDAAFDGDEIVLANGTYTGPGNRDIELRGKALTIRSAHGPRHCTLDCQGGPEESHRAFYIHEGEGQDTVISGLTITNGYFTEGALAEGGGIFCFGAGTAPRIVNCVLSGNSGRSGGAIACYRASPDIQDCVISGNTALSDKGGGISAWDSAKPHISGCVIVDNKANFVGGGCSFYYNSAGQLTNSIIWGNSAGGNAQQLETGMDGWVSVSYCVVEGGWPGTGNRDTDPSFVDYEGGDYHLQLGSQCIDGGDPAYAVRPNEFDIDGEPRLVGAAVDIGADEMSDMRADLDNNGTVQGTDLHMLLDNWLVDPPQNDPNALYDLYPDGKMDIKDFAAFAWGWANTDDVEAPSSPSGLTVTTTTESSVSLQWLRSTDNNVVAGYIIYRDGVFVGWSNSPAYVDCGLDPASIYKYTVAAYDCVYNESATCYGCLAATAPATGQQALAN